MLTIIPTIDVEAIRSLTRLGDFDKLILGNIGNEYFGVPRILEVFSEYNITGSFFVDFAEIGHTDNQFIELNNLILSQDSDIQLHIHPQFCADKSRPLLRQYSLEEQTSIFKCAIDNMKLTTDSYPKAFRAGGYGADNNTLLVMKQYGINLDSSFFPNHINCGISGRSVNSITHDGGITEFPVTVFENRIGYTLGSKVLHKGSLLKKLDIDSCSIEELTKAIDVLAESGLQYVCLFLHSYSLIKWNPTYTQYYPDNNDIDKLNVFIKYCKSKGHRFSNITDEYENLLKAESIVEGIPLIDTRRKLTQSAHKLLKSRLRSYLRGK